MLSSKWVRVPSGITYRCSQRQSRKEGEFGGDGHPARHVLVGWASCPSNLTDGLEARPTEMTGWKPVLLFCITLRSYPLRVQNF
jgi:hypothetical protein